MNVTGHIMQSLGTGLPNSLGIVLVLMYDPLFPKPIVYVGVGGVRGLEHVVSYRFCYGRFNRFALKSTEKLNLCDGGLSLKDNKIIWMVLFVK